MRPARRCCCPMRTCPTASRCASPTERIRSRGARLLRLAGRSARLASPDYA
jgi:hypothetical protein